MNRAINEMLEALAEAVLPGLATGDTVRILSRISGPTSPWEPSDYRKDTVWKVLRGSSSGGVLLLQHPMKPDGHPFRLKTYSNGTFALIDVQTYKDRAGKAFTKNRKLRVEQVRK